MLCNNTAILFDRIATHW